MRIFLIWAILIGSCSAQLRATGVATWEDTVRGTRHAAFGPGGAPVLCYQNDQGQWDFIRDEFEQLGDSLVWHSIYGNHRIFADSTGAAIYAVGNHYLGTRTTHLIRFDKSDSTWTTLKASNPDSISMNGNKITFHEIFPGINKELRNNPKVIRLYQETFILSQQARDSLAQWGPWANCLLGTATKLNTDSLNLTLADALGAFEIDTAGRLTDGWVKFSDGDALIFCLARTYLQCEDSTVQSIPVHKFLVKKSNSFYLVELFNPIAANQLPEGPIWHNATFGYKVDASIGVDIEDYMHGNRAIPSTSGTADSMTAYMLCSFVGKPVRYALYKYYTTFQNQILIDTVAQFTVPPDVGVAWYSKPLLNNGAIVGGDKYGLIVWGGDDSGLLDLYRDYTGNAADSLLSDPAEYDAAWPDPITSLASYKNYQFGLYCTYTESGGPTPKPQGIIIGMIIDLLSLSWGTP